MPERKPRQLKRLTPGEIRKLKRHSIDPEELKDYHARLDLFKDERGEIYVMPKDGSGPGEPSGINVNELE